MRRLIRPSFGARVGTALVVACGAAVVIALGILQYRWNREANDATGIRLADSLQLSMVNWHVDLVRSLAEICLALRDATPQGPTILDRSAAGTVGSPTAYAGAIASWRARTRYPDLVRSVSVVGPGSGESRAVVAGKSPQDDGPDLGPLIVRLMQLPHTPATASLDTAPADRSIGFSIGDWRFDPSVPALVQPLPAPRTWLVVALDRQVLREQVLRDLAYRYFQGTNGLDYEVAVVATNDGARPIYASDPGFGGGDVADADGRMDVFARGGGAIRIFHRTTGSDAPVTATGITWFPLVPADSNPQWQLVVRHRRGGPLGPFMEQMRQRGLAISVGALLLLIVSMSLLVVIASRAHRLGQLQMDFVTAVSHELRTPLTIIGSAADNLTDGVVDRPEQLREYGTVISNEVSQLSGLVERILLFASARAGTQQYVLEPLDVADIVQAVLTSTAALLRASEFTVDVQVPPGVPRVQADRLALSHCLENLITNALKYGKDGQRLRVAVASAASTVEIRVEDGGPGIDPADLPHVFEPFYRGGRVRTGHVHGTGLGLALARLMAEAMRGTLTAQNGSRGGALFVLRLPAAETS
jgi:signal transduction histidine kinase